MSSPPRPVPFNMSLYRFYPVLGLGFAEGNTSTKHPSRLGQSFADPNEHRSFLATMSSNATDGDLRDAFDKYLPPVVAQCMYRCYITHVFSCSLFGHPLYNYEQNPDFDEDDIDDGDDCVERLTCAVEDDNKDDFVQLINSLSESSLTEQEVQLELVSCDMFAWDSAHCASAILAGETKISYVVDWLSSSPLHEAASCCALKITALLLEIGFSPNARYKFDYPYSRNELPLGVALSYLRSNLPSRVYKGRTSAVKFTIDLFRKGLWALGTVRLLAYNTRDVKHEFFKYLKEGKMVEVGALLLVDRCQLLSSSTDKRKYHLDFGSISEMHEVLLAAKRSLCIGADPSQLQKDKLIEMEETLLLLEIFDRIGDKLATLFQLDSTQTGLTCDKYLAAASLIEDAGFDVKQEYLYEGKYDYYSNLRFRSTVLEKDVDNCKKTALTTYLPSWLKEAAFSGSAHKTVGTSSPTYPFLLEAIPRMNCVQAQASNLASPSATLEIMPLHLLKKSASVLGCLKWAFRHG